MPTVDRAPTSVTSDARVPEVDTRAGDGPGHAGRLAALALGLATSWLDTERRAAELRAAASPADVAPARELLHRLRTSDPAAAVRALDLLAHAFPEGVIDRAAAPGRPADGRTEDPAA